MTGLVQRSWNRASDSLGAKQPREPGGTQRFRGRKWPLRAYILVLVLRRKSTPGRVDAGGALERGNASSVVKASLKQC